MLAGVSRNCRLGDELRVLVRKYRMDTQFSLSVKQAIEILLTAAASREDSGQWNRYIGDALTELAFEDLEDDAGDVLHSCIQHLCHMSPGLWAHCGRADAALAGYAGR